MLNFTPKRLLVLAPHTDDGEIGAGAFINKLVQGGIEKKYIGFSTCEQSLPKGYPKGTLAKECMNATKTLGFSQNDVTLLGFKVRRFSESRQELLEELIKIKRDFNPDLVLSTSSHDIHQDHSVVHQEALRAFKDRTLLGYEFPWNCIEFRTSMIVKVKKEHIDSKIEAIKKYTSQSFRLNGNVDQMSHLAELRGSQIGTRFAEAFEVIRWVWN